MSICLSIIVGVLLFFAFIGVLLLIRYEIKLMMLELLISHIEELH